MKDNEIYPVGQPIGERFSSKSGDISLKGFLTFYAALFIVLVLVGLLALYL